MRKSAYVIDGIVKLLLAAVLVIFLPALGAFFLVPAWIIITAAVLLFLSSATEISYGVSKGTTTYLRHIIIADVVIVGAAVLGIVLASLGNPAGGFIWFGLLALASLAIAVVFTTGANGPDFGKD
ncbi:MULTISPECIES: hypothetical protein [Brevibacterium]|jgi:hypothetical protein|uniref:Uncharacterized protein n=1 Tax=Brevibacterium casei TaxID=33889 RepID=A0A7T3ZXA4_9MICO|nr:hypothetical protein [Brevibacterium casei]QQB13315.1 hypothetical protein I6H47_10710 [Brevibacterium casei]